MSKNLAPITFLSAYFLTIVAGNIIFLSPFGRESLQKTGYSAAIFQFDTLFSVGFWSLLFAPFIVTPLIVKAVRCTMESYVCKLAGLIPEFRKVDYAVVTAVCLGYVFFSLWRAEAFSLFASGADAVSSVEARFRILGHMGFVAMAILMSLLSYLSVYSLVRSMRSGEKFWSAATAFNVTVMSVFLTVLNMKWPILIFYAGLILAVFVYAKRRVYLKVAIGSVLLVAVYLLISTYVFRLAAPNLPSVTTPPPEVVMITGAPGSAASPSATTISTAPAVSQSPAESTSYRPSVLRMAETAIERAPWLIFAAINRMAIIYPYYYQVFTNEGAVCGGILEQARRGPACRPSTFIYARMFKNDKFAGVGTSPAPVHVSGYALGGWPVALFALVAASVILGLFASLPLDASASVGSLGIVGAIAGYHFSQLPGEGPLIYDHGVLWPILALLLYSGARALYVYMAARITIKKNTENQV